MILIFGIWSYWKLVYIIIHSRKWENLRSKLISPFLLKYESTSFKNFCFHILFFLVYLSIVSKWNLLSNLFLFYSWSKVNYCHLLGDIVRNFLGVEFLDFLLFEEVLCYFLDIPPFLFGVFIVSNLNWTLL